jgi:hypothetical protein
VAKISRAGNSWPLREDGAVANKYAIWINPLNQQVPNVRYDDLIVFSVISKSFYTSRRNAPQPQQKQHSGSRGADENRNSLE